MDEGKKILPFNGYAVDVYNFDGEVDVFVEKVFAIEIWGGHDESARTGSVVRSVFSSSSQPEHVALYFIDDKYNIFNDDDSLVIIENESLLLALKNLCDHLASKYKDEKLPVKSVGFSLGSYNRTYKVSLADEVEK